MGGVAPNFREGPPRPTKCMIFGFNVPHIKLMPPYAGRVGATFTRRAGNLRRADAAFLTKLPPNFRRTSAEPELLTGFIALPFVVAAKGGAYTSQVRKHYLPGCAGLLLAMTAWASAQCLPSSRIGPRLAQLNKQPNAASDEANQFDRTINSLLLWPLTLHETFKLVLHPCQQRATTLPLVSTKSVGNVS